ncbi:hypothetical protein Cgig2_028999 [Carnegiea gigantea]|uniref:Uncharacterized protein n=1 Tax=Carnegiea gigantea TaxID=171969 RepID=A0A9Q1JJ50_9CARY|nr:hypothetical protein Cgig2_028999 [Carnegiea gigantea]
MAEQAAEYYELPELPQVIFNAMLLNEAEKLGVPHGPRLWSLEVALTELRWGAFESWIWLFSDRVYEAQFYPKSGSGEGARAGRQGESSSEGVTANDAAPEGLLEGSSLSSTRSLNLHHLQVRRMAKTKSTPRIQSPDELLAEGTLGNPCSVPPQSIPEAEVASSNSSTSSRSCSPSSASGHSSRSSSSEGASTSSYPKSSLGPGGLVPKQKGRTPPINEIVAEGSEFPGAPTRLDPRDGPRSHFPEPKAVTKLKRSALEKQYLLPVEYSKSLASRARCHPE